MVRCVVLAVCVTACGFRSPPVDGDAATAELIIEAEDFSSAMAQGVYHWTLASDRPGYSGAGFMQCQPDNGPACMILGQVTMCGAQLIYQVAIPEPGTYYFHVRTLARDRTEDSLWYGIDSTVDSMDLDLPDDDRWHWSTGDRYMLTAGPHTVHIWRREPGARVDALALTTSPTPPP